jgi:hypothetical protein
LQGLDGGLRPRSGADAWLAQHAGRLLSCLPAHGAELAAMADQLGLELAGPVAA